MTVLYGYVRVSTREQNEARQIIALLEEGVPRENIYMDKQSGKDFERKMYCRLVRKLSPGDVLFIKSIDRLGRNYSEVLEQWKVITKDKGVDVVVLDMPILDTRQEKNLMGTFLSDVVLALLSYVSENEREMIHRRQAEGIAAAKERGVHFGRKPMPTPEYFEEVYYKWKQKEISASEAADICNMSKSTFYKKVKEFQEQL